MKSYDEPIIETNLPITPTIINNDHDLQQKIADLVKNEAFAILCTQGDDQPYGSIIAFTVSEDLKQAVFATPVNTRKYNLISKCSKISLVVDDRSKLCDDITKIKSVTITGIARLLDEETDDKKSWKLALIHKHPYLKQFVNSPSSAIIAIDFVRYFYVARFQEVQQWKP